MAKLITLAVFGILMVWLLASTIRQYAAIRDPKSPLHREFLSSGAGAQNIKRVKTGLILTILVAALLLFNVIVLLLRGLT